MEIEATRDYEKSSASRFLRLFISPTDTTKLLKRLCQNDKNIVRTNEVLEREISKYVKLGISSNYFYV